MKRWWLYLFRPYIPYFIILGLAGVVLVAIMCGLSILIMGSV